MNLRDAEVGDSRMLFEWANDTEVRKMAFSSEPIEWESHNEWFKRKLAAPNSRIYIALTDEDEAVGQIRFDPIKDAEAAEAKVDVHTKPNLRGKGVGTQIISLGVLRFFDQSQVNTVHATIKLENAKSYRAFEKSGFREVGKTVCKGHRCFHMIKNRP